MLRECGSEREREDKGGEQLQPDFIHCGRDRSNPVRLKKHVPNHHNGTDALWCVDRVSTGTNGADASVDFQIRMGSQDRNFAEGVQYQKVCISGNDQVGTAVDRRFQEFIVARIAAGLDGAQNGNHRRDL